MMGGHEVAMERLQALQYAQLLRVAARVRVAEAG